MRYAYAATTALLLTGSALALVNGSPVTAQTALPVSAQANLAPAGAPASFADLVVQLQPAVVNISTKQKVQVATSLNPFTGERRPVTQEQASGGSGFLISSDGYIVTNNHVVAGGPTGDAVDRVTVTLFDGKEYTAEIVGRDPQSDIALLKIKATDLPFVAMADSTKSRVGDWVIAIGNPLGLSSSVTAGIISALQRNIGAGGAYDRFIQTDTAINPGNSGGPLFNLKGEVIGINNRLISPIGANIGVGFAIPAEEAKPVIESLKKGVRPERGYLGVGIRPVNEKLADSLGIEKNRGEEVTGVVPGQAGDKGGLKEFDIVLKIDGQDVSPERTLSYIIANTKPGSRATLEILREGKPQKLNVIVGTRPTEEQIAKSNFNPDEQKEFDGETNEASAKYLRDALGISVIPLDEAIARRLGIPADTRGLVIDIAGSGTVAQAGIQRADIIVSVNYKSVTTPEELVTAIKSARAAGRSNILLGVRRRGGPTQFAAVGID
ncbi:PDZ domain-containing protein [Sphingorhabdus lacus]|uniref:PDZ domain-containing protein n=1 Tax=Sphingorhabdus lacus TaxID=392610 RepID=A0A6I6L459_9SPHN|nr:trypsin-like peptidase domain-containing protein [Sphingorhabdus lacus]QGY80870.1 PDZ domain-containing protein [Sphingorhabdus lacus]